MRVPLLLGLGVVTGMAEMLWCWVVVVRGKAQLLKHTKDVHTEPIARAGPG